MNRITRWTDVDFTDPDFEEDYAPEETAYWQQNLSGRSDLQEVPGYILQLIVVGVVALIAIAVVYLKLT